MLLRGKVRGNFFQVGNFLIKFRCMNWCTAHLWIVPAKVEGTWKTPQGELVLKQSFQMLTGTLKNGNVAAPISNAPKARA